MTTFSGLNLAQPILRAITDGGYTTPTPIQEKSIPALLQGRDLLGVAQTGTGKTAAFALPLLHRLSETPRKAQSRKPLALILAPTRELASQINDSLRIYGRHVHLRSCVIFGGTSARPQIQALNRGVHIAVATPGRLLDTSWASGWDAPSYSDSSTRRRSMLSTACSAGTACGPF